MRRPLLERIKAMVASRTGVLALTTGGSLVVRTASSMILTRLLSPAAFGTVGVVNSIFFAITMITDLGFQSYVVRHERGDERHFQSVIWTIHALRGLALCAFAVAASPLIARLLGKPELALPLAVASGIFVFGGVGSLSLIVAIRNDGARKLSLFEFGLQIAQSVICVLLALWLRNSWALIGALLAQAFLRATLGFILFPGVPPRFARDREIQRDFFIFSRLVLASSSVALLLAQTDKLVLARLLTLSQFGLYAIALNLASAPASFADSYVNRVTFPIYARTFRDDPAHLPYVYYAARRAPALLYALACGGVIGSARLMIAILYDPRYLPAATFLSLLVISSALRFPNLAAAELMTAIGKLKGTLHGNLVRLGWLVVAIPLGYLFLGPVGIIAAVGLIEVPALGYNWVLLRRERILDVAQEAQFLVLMAGGSLLGWGVSSAVLAWQPNL